MPRRYRTPATVACELETLETLYTPTELQLQRRANLLATRTPSELRLEAELIGRNIQFEPQSIAQGFFVDFRILPWKLAVEVDGWYHDLARTIRDDRWRESILLNAQWSILRFTNKEVQKDTRTVADFIQKAVAMLIARPEVTVGRTLALMKKLKGE